MGKLAVFVGVLVLYSFMALEMVVWWRQGRFGAAILMGAFFATGVAVIVISTKYPRR